MVVNRLLALFLVVPLFLVCGKRSDSLTGNRPEYVPGEVIVRIKDETPYDAARLFLIRFREVKIVDLAYWIYVSVETAAVDSLAKELEKSPYIEYTAYYYKDISKKEIPLSILTKGCAYWSYFTDLLSKYPEIKGITSYRADIASLSVAVGKEKMYVDMFNKIDQIVKYAFLNSYYYAA